MMLGRTLFQDERRQRGAVLRVMCLALMTVVGAVASLNVALPELARDTGASQTQLQWIVTAYALASRRCSSRPARSATGSAESRFSSRAWRSSASRRRPRPS
jgi:hypothetical protein